MYVPKGSAVHCWHFGGKNTMGTANKENHRYMWENGCQWNQKGGMTALKKEV